MIREFLEHGTSEKYETLAADYPIGMLTMTVVHGIGPKRAMRLYEEGYSGIEALVEAAREGKLDPKLTEAVLATTKKESKRIPYEDAKRIADKVRECMLALPNVLDATVCGSIRRKLETAKDIDIAVCIDESKTKVIDLSYALMQGKIAFEVISGGEKRISITLPDEGGIQCDFWFAGRESYGALLNHCTGSREWNIFVRTMAQVKGLTVNEYGVWRGDEKLGGENEEDLFRVLGIDWVEPENRSK